MHDPDDTLPDHELESAAGGRGEIVGSFSKPEDPENPFYEGRDVSNGR